MSYRSFLCKELLKERELEDRSEDHVAKLIISCTIDEKSTTWNVEDKTFRYV